MTRWRLSDHDEWAMHRLATHCATYRDHRPGLDAVHIRNGWGVASDAFRVLALPLETERDGVVSRLDAWRGGTVDLAPLPAPDDPSSLWDPVDRLAQCASTKPFAWLGPDDIALLDRSRRQPLGMPREGEPWPGVSWWPRGFAGTGLVLPDGRSIWCSPRPLRRGACQPRWLADAAVAVADASDSDSVRLVEMDRALLVISHDPADLMGEWTGGWSEGWAMVSGLGLGALPLPSWVPAAPQGDR